MVGSLGGSHWRVLGKASPRGAGAPSQVRAVLSHSPLPVSLSREEGRGCPEAMPQLEGGEASPGLRKGVLFLLLSDAYLNVPRERFMELYI